MGVKVVARPISYQASPAEKERAFKSLFAAFKRVVNEAGILTEYSRKQAFETEGQKKRRKKREGAFQRKKGIQEKWRENFGQSGE